MSYAAYDAFVAALDADQRQDYEEAVEAVVEFHRDAMVTTGEGQEVAVKKWLVGRKKALRVYNGLIAELQMSGIETVDPPLWDGRQRYAEEMEDWLCSMAELARVEEEEARRAEAEKKQQEEEERRRREEAARRRREEEERQREAEVERRRLEELNRREAVAMQERDEIATELERALAQKRRDEEETRREQVAEAARKALEDRLWDEESRRTDGAAAEYRRKAQDRQRRLEEADMAAVAGGLRGSSAGTARGGNADVPMAPRALSVETARGGIVGEAADRAGGGRASSVGTAAGGYEHVTFERVGGEGSEESEAEVEEVAGFTQCAGCVKAGETCRGTAGYVCERCRRLKKGCTNATHRTGGGKRKPAGEKGKAKAGGAARKPLEFKTTPARPKGAKASTSKRRVEDTSDTGSEAVVVVRPTKRRKAARGTGRFEELERGMENASERLGELTEELGVAGAEINARLIEFGQRFQRVRLEQERIMGLLELLKREYEGVE